MTDTNVRSIHWQAIFPGLLLLKAARVAFRPSVFFVAAIGLWLTCCSWWLLDLAFFGKGESDSRAQIYFVTRAMEDPRGGVLNLFVTEDVPPFVRDTDFGPMQRFALRFYGPASTFFDTGITVRQLWYLVCGLLLQLAIWALFGAIITRQALVELATGEPADFFDSVQYALGKYFFHFSAPLFPFIGVVMLMIPLMIMGLFMRADWGLLVSGLLWLFAVPAGFAAAWLLVGLALGWPLLWGGVSAEPDGDHFGSTSRMYSYVFQRPLHYLIYVIVAIVLGVLAGWLMDHFALAAIEVMRWGASWGAGHERMKELEDHLATGTAHKTGIVLIRLVETGIWYVAAGFGAGFFWCSFAGIYLLMRKAADDKELDEVYLDYHDLKPPSVTDRPAPAPRPTSPPVSSPPPVPVTPPVVVTPPSDPLPPLPVESSAAVAESPPPLDHPPPSEVPPPS